MLRLNPEIPRVILWVGPPRSGKTYHAVQVLLYWAKHYGSVITNIPLTRQFDRVHRVSDDELAPEHFIGTVEAYRSGLPVLVVIDEASISWDSREWQRVGSDVRGYLATVGHRATSVIVIGQSVSMIDSVFRRLARYCVVHSDCVGKFVWLFTPHVRRYELLGGAEEKFQEVLESGYFLVGQAPYVSEERAPSLFSGYLVRILAFAFLVFLVMYLAHSVKLYWAGRFGGARAASPPSPAVVVPRSEWRIVGAGDDFLIVERGGVTLEVRGVSGERYLERESVSDVELYRLKRSSRGDPQGGSRDAERSGEAKRSR